MEKTNQQNQNSQKAETKKEESAKALSGTETPSSWEKAAEMIAGDNQLMKTLMKLLISPFTLIAGAGLIAYLFFKNKGYKDEIAKLKEENTKLLDEKSFFEQKAEKHKKNFKRLEKMFEIEQEQAERKILPNGNNHSSHIHNVNKNRVTSLR